MEQNKYVLVVNNEDPIQININQDINRPNQPDDYELIADYVENNYGMKQYEVVDLSSLEMSIKNI